jgi:hypothetical protein
MYKYFHNVNKFHTGEELGLPYYEKNVFWEQDAKESSWASARVKYDGDFCDMWAHYSPY